MRHLVGCGGILPKHYLKKGMKHIMTGHVKLHGMGAFGTQMKLESNKVPSGEGIKRTTLKFKM